MNLKKIWDYISNVGVELESDKESIQYIRLLNQYTVIVSFVFFIHAIHNFVYIKDNFSGNILMYLSLFFVLTFLLKRLRRIKILVCSVFILLIWVIFFFDSYSVGGSGIYFYYFPLVMALPFIFNWESEYRYMLIIIGCVVVSVLINYFTGYSLFTDPELTLEIKRNTTFVSASMSGIIVAVDLVFITRKNKIIHDLYAATKEKEILLEEKQKQLDSLSEKERVDVDKIQRLIQMVVHNDPSFFSSFSEVYPFFFKNILNLAPNLSVSELECCAWIKLGFSTKEIAKYKFLSIRAIEARKYRIRKKLNFNSEKELIAWMIDSDSAQ